MVNGSVTFMPEPFHAATRCRPEGSLDVVSLACGRLMISPIRLFVRIVSTQLDLASSAPFLHVSAMAMPSRIVYAWSFVSTLPESGSCSTSRAYSTVAARDSRPVMRLLVH